MMSILLLTLLSWLHCHPPSVMFRVSLLPVAKVVSSPVQKVVDVESSAQLEPDSKSRVKVAFVKSGSDPEAPTTESFSETVSVVLVSDTLNRSAQSCWLVRQKPVSGAGGQLCATFPSSCRPVGNS